MSQASILKVRSVHGGGISSLGAFKPGSRAIGVTSRLGNASTSNQSIGKPVDISEETYKKRLAQAEKQYEKQLKDVRTIVFEEARAWISDQTQAICDELRPLGDVLNDNQRFFLL